MFKVYHRRQSGVLIVNFEHVLHLFSGASIVEFEQVNVSWVFVACAKITHEEICTCLINQDVNRNSKPNHVFHTIFHDVFCIVAKIGWYGLLLTYSL